MKYDLTRKILYDNTSESTLYKWSLKEVDLETNKIGPDQIPWRFSSFFILNDLTVFHSVASDWSTKQESHRFEETITIKANLQSGFLDNNGLLKDRINFSMFGTDRTINNISLRIQKLTDESENEVCVSDGIVSYVHEVDFEEEKVNDCLEFTVTLRPSIFNNLVRRIETKSVNNAYLRLSGVDGFYAIWSPSISAHSVKILTLADYHEPENDPSKLSSIPTLRKVEEFDLVFKSQHELYKEQKLTEEFLNRVADEAEQFKQTELSNNVQLNGNQILLVMDSLRKKLNLITVLLGLIVVFIFLQS
jgi:hypothetical protein